MYSALLLRAGTLLLLYSLLLLCQLVRVNGDTRLPPLGSRWSLSDTRLPPLGSRLSLSDTRLPLLGFRWSLSDTRLPPLGFRLSLSDTRLPLLGFRLRLWDTRLPPLGSRLRLPDVRYTKHRSVVASPSFFQTKNKFLLLSKKATSTCHLGQGCRKPSVVIVCRLTTSFKFDFYTFTKIFLLYICHKISRKKRISVTAKAREAFMGLSQLA